MSACSNLSSASSPRNKFSIDDAFEEDHDDAIRVYGSTTERSPLKPKTRLPPLNSSANGSAHGSAPGSAHGSILSSTHGSGHATTALNGAASPMGGDSGDPTAVRIEDPARSASVSTPSVAGSTKLKLADDTASKDSDSLIQESSASYNMFDPSQSWWQHPKIRENWKMVLAAFVLLTIGVGLVVTGIIVVSLPIHGVQAFVFFIAGAICFIPGAYHVIYIYLAVKGKRGYDFYHLPLFN